MGMQRLKYMLFSLGVCLASGLVGCSNGSTTDAPEIDVSLLAPEQRVIEYAAQGDLDNLKALIEGKPAYVNVQGDYGRTPLHFAAAHGHDAVVEYLLEHGANPLATDENGDTPLTAALDWNHRGVANSLREAARKFGAAQ